MEKVAWEGLSEHITVCLVVWLHSEIISKENIDLEGRVPALPHANPEHATK